MIPENGDVQVALRAKYYQGPRPKAVEVEVACLADGLEIRFPSPNAPEKRIWPLKGIQPDEHPGDGKLIIAYGAAAAREYLEFQDINALEQLGRSYPGIKWQKGIRGRHLWLALSSLAVLAISLVFLAYFFGLPRLADSAAAAVPMEWEMDLGKQISERTLSGLRIDETRSRWLDTFFAFMEIPSDYPIRLYYAQDSLVNAFAMPGGAIVIYSGLFDRLSGPEALAGLVAHEYAHVEKRHSLKSLFRSLGGFLVLSAVFGDLTGLAGLLVDNANTIQNLSYSRHFEREADATAVELLLARDIDLIGMQELFEVLIAEGNRGLEVPEFLRTHPVTQDRLEFARQKALNQKPVRDENLAMAFDSLRQAITPLTPPN
ncbi:MAG: M48 family metallopeptidase [Saprospiraceae bacterium]|mgnify:CR=1 FL=1|jgi:predicted Zn-dependent protease|nr:M48 family metallopeptidase [Saprospiraceae bacterium]MBP9209210.1 M48 family metallopeptidase [Saprospiraceae bacterium]MBV6472987.1 Beta-barrel assembly-enhancing protease [Saprospiraceae bacterium]